MNQLNLKNLTGKVIKQGDFESPFRFELQDFSYKSVKKHDGLEATIKIGKGSEVIYQTTSTVQNSIVEFEFDNAIPVGIYRVEITVGESVYPSDHSMWLTVESSMVEYQPQEVYRVVELTKDELSKMFMGDISTYDDTEIKRRLTELETNRQTFDISPINKRIESLENKVDKDTIYDDSALTERIQVLEEKVDKDTIYDDTSLTERIQVLESKVDKDTVYDDTSLKERIQALEERTDADTIYDDKPLKQRVELLEDRRPHRECYVIPSSYLPTGFTDENSTFKFITNGLNIGTYQLDVIKNLENNAWMAGKSKSIPSALLPSNGRMTIEFSGRGTEQGKVFVHTGAKGVLFGTTTAINHAYFSTGIVTVIVQDDWRDHIPDDWIKEE